jgi:CRISPR-associated endoribonuclease Cas6
VSSASINDEHGPLVSMVLRLEPAEPGWLTPSCGPQLQAAFLQLVRQVDPELSAWLHQPNQRRPYTLSLLWGFRQLSIEGATDCHQSPATSACATRGTLLAAADPLR